MDEVLRWSGAADLRGRYTRGEVSPTEVTRATLELLERTEPTLHAFLTVTADLASAQAAEAERLIRTLGTAAWAGRPLLGLPVSVKDLMATAGVRTTRGSLRYADRVPARDAPAVARLRRAGAVLIGKTTTSEFGWSAGTVNRLAPPAANPWDPTRSAGGSSGGAAAAVAAGVGVAALGTDGAGSIRVPAAFCGVVGFKPTFGRVPYLPVSPEGLSHLGPLARDVATAALVIDVVAGPDPADPFSTGVRVVEATGGPVRVGWLGGDDPPTEVEAIVRAAADALGPVTEVAVPFPDPYDDLITILAAFDAAAEEGVTAADAGLADPARLRVADLGGRLRAADLARALAGRVRLIQHLDRLMGRFDLLAMPTVRIPPFPAHAWRPDPDGTDLDWLRWCRAAYPFNLTGQPAISVPAGRTAAGHPVGLQLVGRRYEDPLVLAAATRFERDRPWKQYYARQNRGPECTTSSC